MLEKVTRNLKKTCGFSLGQLYFILALSGRIQYTGIYAFEELYEAGSNIAYSHENVSLTDKCKRYINADLCGYSTSYGVYRYCFSATYRNALPSNEDYNENSNINEENYKITFTIKCKEQPDDITQHFDTFSRPEKPKHVELYVQNLLEVPTKFFDGNISYSAKLEYDSNAQNITSVLSHSQNLLGLSVFITAYAEDETWFGYLLHPLTALRQLLLSMGCKDDDIIILPTDSFSTLNELEELDLHVCGTRIMFRKKPGLRNLTHEHFRYLTKLKGLNLSYNNMQTLVPDLFSALYELNILDLMANNLHHLPPNLFAAQSKLVTLNLSYNQLAYLPTELFAHTPRLSKLMLLSNKLYSMGNMLATLKPLNYLNLLDLSYNQFESIAYGNETLLTQITLNTFKNGNYETPKLDISHNKVASNITIKLSSNRIKYFYAFTLPMAVTPTYILYLDLNDNPLHCDCQLVWFYYLYLLPASIIRTDSTTWFCASPPHLAGCSFRTLQLENVCERAANVCPPKCKCTRAYGDDGSAALVVNCNSTHIDTTSANLPRSEKVSVAQTTIYMERCNLTELPLNLINGYANVTRLYAAHNNITTTSSLQLPSTLLLLDLQANNLQRLSPDFLKFLNKSLHLQALYLSHNPWLCDCEAMQSVYTLRKHRARIPDIDQLSCANIHGVPLLHVDPVDICRTSDSAANSALLVLLLFAIMLLILTALYYKYKLEVKIWLYAHNLCVFWIKEDEFDQNKPFDAFISYAHEQSQYVGELLSGLEHGQPSFRICIHDRNWLVGACIPDQIARSIEQSCRTIFILSQDFINSRWARLEFRTAHQCALNEGRTRIIIIKYDELPNLDRLEPELQAYLKTNTYLEPNDPRFWQRLRYAMPHRKRPKCGTNTLYIPDEMELNNQCNKRST